MKYVFLLISIVLAVDRSSGSKPHIILIVADDLGWNDVSFHGSNQIPTPNIDALASAGVILNNYYVSPICTPSRGALMSGKHPIHTGLQHDVIHAGEPWGLPLNVTTLPQHLKQLGYSTHAVGKWHLGYSTREYTPTFRGFDSHYGYWNGYIDYYQHTQFRANLGLGIDFHNNLTIVDEVVGKYATELFTRQALDIIKNHDPSRPLFLYLAHLAVHVASKILFQAPPEYVARFPHIKDYRRRVFAGMLSAMDDSVGQIFEALHQKSMLDNAVIVLTTDNGGAAGGIDQSVGSNWPLRGSKYTLWEGGVRGTAIFWSSLLPEKKGRSSDQLMHITDWMPTFYYAAGGDVSKLGNIYGMNMWNCLIDDRHQLGSCTYSPRKEVLHNIDPRWKYSALRFGDYKIVVGSVFNGAYDGWYEPIGEGDETPKSDVKVTSSTETILRDNGWKMNTFVKYQVNCGPRPGNVTTNCQPLKSPCLFNIKKDPCEYKNLAENEPKMLAELQKRLKTLSDTAVPPANVPADPRAAPGLHNGAWVPWLDQLN